MFANQTSCWWEHLPESKIHPDFQTTSQKVAQMICFRLVVVWTSGCTSFQHKSVTEASESLRNQGRLSSEWKLVQVQRRWTSNKKWVELLKRKLFVCVYFFFYFYRWIFILEKVHFPVKNASQNSKINDGNLVLLQNLWGAMFQIGSKCKPSKSVFEAEAVTFYNFNTRIVALSGALRREFDVLMVLIRYWDISDASIISSFFFRHTTLLSCFEFG